MNPFGDLASITRVDEPMAAHTSFGVGGIVRYFIQPQNTEQFHLIYQRCHHAGYPIRVLGRGCNVLVADGYHDWAVISTRRLDRYQRTGNRVQVDAGLSLGRLVRLAERWGLGGLEPLAGIPGSVGGAVAMNAGGRAGCIGDHLVRARVAFPGGLAREMDTSELGLGYRSSYLVDGRPCLLSATFRLEPVPTQRLEASRKGYIQQKRESQPMAWRSAGCIFKNPPGGSAGQLIDQAGLKGTVIGDAVVSEMHANFILNRGHATATDILRLIDLIVERVFDVHGVRLEPEVKIWRSEHSPAATPQPHGKEQPWASRTAPESPSSTADALTNVLSR